MAQLPKCYGCNKFNWKLCMCEIYDKNIPKDIHLELKECEYYEPNQKDTNNEYPTAKGR